MTKTEVLETMGSGTVQTWDWRFPWLLINFPDEKITNPWRVESYEAGGHTWEVVFYYTDRKAADNALTDDEMTPIVLMDGKVQGWGWTYWDTTAATYNIRIRR